MNRRSFLARCLSGAVLGMARVLPMPELPKVTQLPERGSMWFGFDFGTGTDMSMVATLSNRYGTFILDDLVVDSPPCAPS
jgi:hypothetical protein